MKTSPSPTPREVVEPLLDRLRMTLKQKREFWRRYSRAMHLELAVHREILEDGKS